MNFKKMIIINSIIYFLLCFLFHYVYEWFPNPILSIFFPVNESIWEHMKMLWTAGLVSCLIEYLILKNNNNVHNNFALVAFIKSIIIIPIYLVIFLPIYSLTGENMFLAISTMLISIIIVNIIEYKIIMLPKLKYQFLAAIVSIINVYTIMGVLTYKAPHNYIFYDAKKHLYGINDYIN